MSRWKKKDSRTIATSTLFTMVEDDVVMPDGIEMKYTLIDFPDFAGVLPVHKNKFVLIRNYRYPIDEYVLEFPAGLIDHGETPIQAVERELEEETGYLLESSEKLCTYHPISSLNTQTAHIFIGRASKGGKRSLDDGEDMEVCLMGIDETYKMLEKGELTHPHTMIALFYAKEVISRFR